MDAAKKPPEWQEPGPSIQGTVLFWLVHFLVIFVCVGLRFPGVNESHYLPKAKKVWEESYAAGGDLFLESHDAHLLASTAAGLLAKVFSLPLVAATLRIAAWACMAFAWLSFARSLGISRLFSPLALLAWILFVRYLHWAGEWAIGGFEAKAIAYPAVILAIASVNRANWNWTWFWTGVAIAWHPVVGGWVGLSLGILWLLELRSSRSKSSQSPPATFIQTVWNQRVGIAAGFAMSLAGVLPALQSIGGVDRIGNVSAAQVHVYYRIAHHMAPQLFAPERHAAGAMTLGVLILISVLYVRSGDKRRSSTNLLLLAWTATLFAFIGLSIDLTLSVPRPDIASKLLRFYWFRWADVAAPLAIICVCFQFLTRVCYVKSDSDGTATLSPTGSWLSPAILGTVSLLAGWHVYIAWNKSTSEADELLLAADLPNTIDTDRHRDWLAVCYWIRENTPEDSLWLTPKYQQTFKWHTGRAEVVCWKDIPQDAASIVEWYDRIQKTALPRTTQGEIRDWTTEELIELARTYGFQYVLLDKGTQLSPPALEILYPIETENRSFAVFRILDDML